MLRGALVVFVLFLSNLSFSQEEIENSWLWQISGGELQGKSFLFGTLPVNDSTFFQFPDRVFKSLDQSDVFIYFDESDFTKSNYSPFHDAAFSKLNNDFGSTPVEYLKGIANQGLKPLIELEEQYSFYNHYSTNLRPVDATYSKLIKLKEEYLTANLKDFANTRLVLDIPEEVNQKISKQLNYQIINQLIDQMRLQPAFIALDGMYLTGQEGIVSLLRARGYKLRPISLKQYETKAKEIEQMKMARAAYEAAHSVQNNPSPQTDNTNPILNNPLPTPTQATENIKLDLPIGILNLSQWSDYELQDGVYKYSAPQRLKTKTENKVFETTYGGLTYQMAIVDKWNNINSQIENLIIQNGGQLVNRNNFQKNEISGQIVELMYAENQISRHLLLQGIEKNIIASVKGATPEIHSLVADQFLQSIQLEQIPQDIQVEKPTENIPIAETLQWGFDQLEGMNFSFPIEKELKETKTANGTAVKAIVSSKSVDKNTYLIVVSKKETFDNFKLFNTAINKATEEVRGVIVERNVLPAGRQNFAEYLVKDAVDNFYRIQYYYQNGNLYQVIIKGDRKSVYNTNAERIIQSITL